VVAIPARSDDFDDERDDAESYKITDAEAFDALLLYIAKGIPGRREHRSAMPVRAAVVLIWRGHYSVEEAAEAARVTKRAIQKRLAEFLKRDRSRGKSSRNFRDNSEKRSPRR
jgi:hypothetical protein